MRRTRLTGGFGSWHVLLVMTVVCAMGVRNISRVIERATIFAVAGAY